MPSQHNGLLFYKFCYLLFHDFRVTFFLLAYTDIITIFTDIILYLLYSYGIIWSVKCFKL